MKAKPAAGGRRREPGIQLDEAGKTFIVMLLVILPTLILVLGVAYDLGNVAAGVTIAQNAADLAAQEAGKLVDAGHTYGFGEVWLSPLAPTVAQQMADEITGGAFRVTDVYATGDVVVVEGWVSVRTPFLNAFLGRRTVTRRVQGIAEAMSGSTRGRGE